jgi:hypothetical protein
MIKVRTKIKINPAHDFIFERVNMLIKNNLEENDLEGIKKDTT